MDLSKSETLTLCQRFLSAVGLPPGVDNEVAESIVWLALRGYPSLVNLSQSNPEFPQKSSIVKQLEIYSGSGLISAADMHYETWVAIADWLVASCGNSRRGESQVQLSNVRNPYFAVPTLLLRSSHGYEFSVDVTSCQAVFSKGDLWTNSDANEFLFLEDEEAMKIHCVQLNEISLKSPPRHLNVRPELRFSGERLIQGENSRIDVDDEIYWKLKKVAARCFVPASEKSRQRGAGAEVDDSA